MPRVNPRAVLEPSEVAKAIKVAKGRGPMVHALLAWMYEFGSRASEPGLQLVDDVDLRGKRARVVHLKKGNKPWVEVRSKAEWHSLMSFCRGALPAWIGDRKSGPLFPSECPGKCYACHGTGTRHQLKRVGKVRSRGIKVPCHHCGATGKRLGISRVEVYRIVTEVLEAAGVPAGCRHPHVLRHSIITHLLEGGIAAATVQDRVGHTDVATTLSYAKATKRSASELENALASTGVYGET